MIPPAAVRRTGSPLRREYRLSESNVSGAGAVFVFRTSRRAFAGLTPTRRLPERGARSVKADAFRNSKGSALLGVVSP